jgi:hypothetical protein
MEKDIIEPDCTVDVTEIMARDFDTDEFTWSARRVTVGVGFLNVSKYEHFLEAITDIEALSIFNDDDGPKREILPDIMGYTQIVDNTIEMTFPKSLTGFFTAKITFSTCRETFTDTIRFEIRDEE